MNRIAAAAIFGLAALLAAVPASAVTLDNGVVLITQADALAGGVTPGDTPGFPVTLSVSGSYRFASNLLVSTAVNGIEVTAPEVTIDLKGFRMAGSGVGLYGTIGFVRALTIVNGTIRGFTQDAIYSGGNDLTVDHMRIVDNPNTRDFGAAITAAAKSTIRNSNISRNAQSGIICMKYCLVEKNIVSDNSLYGVLVIDVGGIILGNTISHNTVFGIAGSAPTTFGDNTVIANAVSIYGTLLPLDPNQPPPPP